MNSETVRSLFDERLDWTAGGYYYKTKTNYLGFISLGTAGIASVLDPGYWGMIYGGMPFGFDNNDEFKNESKSVFAHGIYKITDKLSITAGGRMTDEDKVFAFDHNQLFQIEEPLRYGGRHYDWKLNLAYQFTDDLMAYVTSATGFRSEGANPRPWTRGQLLPTPDEKIQMYEIGTKTQFFENRLRLNAAAFYNEYDPRVSGVFGYQCTNPAGTDPGTPWYGGYGTCPAGTWAGDNAGGVGQFWFTYFSAPGTSKGVELDITAVPIANLDFNASIGWYNYKTDVTPDDLGYMHPDYDLQADWSYSGGVQYRINFKNGSMLIPRIDMFYQGERNNGTVSVKPDEYTTIPDYTVYNGRITYMSADTHWSLSLEAQNLFNKFYWISIGTESTDGGVTPTYGRTGQPGRPRTLALTLRYNIF